MLRTNKSTLLVLLLSLACSCGGTVRVLTEDKGTVLPALDAGKVTVVTDPSPLVASEKGTLTVVAEILSPHGTLNFIWQVDNIGAAGSVAPTSPAAPAAPAAGGAAKSNSASTDEKDGSVTNTLNLTSVNSIATSKTEESRSGSVTIENVWNGITERKTYEFTVTIKQPDGQTPTTPTLAILGFSPTAVTYGSSATFTAQFDPSMPKDDTGATDISGLTFLWDFTSLAPGTSPIQNTQSSVTLAKVTAAPLLTGYDCTLTVWKTAQPAIRTSKTLKVSVTSPTASVTTITPDSAIAGTATLFSAGVNSSVSFSYLWQFGSNQSDATKVPTVSDPVVAKPSVTFPAAGTYPVTLRIYTTTAPFVELAHLDREVVVTGTPTAPTASIGSVVPGAATETVAATFAAAVASNVEFTYLWDFGAGVLVDNPTSATPKATFPAAGTYNGTLQVLTKALPVTPLGTKPFTVEVTAATTPVTPAASIELIVPTAAKATVAATFGAAVASNVEITYLWDFGAGALVDDPNSATPKATFPAAGTYNGMLRVYTKALPISELDSEPFTVTVT